jgi:chemotaxis regulatin CheY-phosphate phosphatase CheZ
MESTVKTLEAEKAKPLSRQQRRFIERIQEEARILHNQLCEKFIDFLVSSDNPEGEEVKEKAKQLSAQWKVFCHRKGMKEEAFGLIEKHCQHVIQEYLAAKEEDNKTTTTINGRFKTTLHPTEGTD